MPQLTDNQLMELLPLIEGADTVELKLTVPESDQRSAVTALRMDPIDAQIRQVFFFDTPDLRLYDKGLVARARRIQGRGDDTVVKLRPVVPAELPAKLRRHPGFGVEVDAMPGGFVCSASLKGVPKNGDVRSVALGDGTLGTLFSKQQRKLFAEHAPDGMQLDDLSVLGPIFVLKLRFVPKELGRKVVAEMWLYPDESRILELSTKCPPQDAFLAAAQTRAFLAGHGIDLAGEQETKTRKALEFFSDRLTAAASSPRKRAGQRARPASRASESGRRASRPARRRAAR
jgi:hypothetical protein